MSSLRHEHVVRLLGVCTKDKPLLLIEEYMANGNLRTFLIKACHAMTYA